ncbi:hypothetical protein MRBLMI12_004429 [Microbacterium sp. LMI12-1-1.1]
MSSTNDLVDSIVIDTKRIVWFILLQSSLYPEELGGLVALFAPETITAGNSSINPALAAVIFTGEGALEAEPLARIAGCAAFRNRLDVLRVAPVEVANRALARAGTTWADVDIV